MGSVSIWKSVARNIFVWWRLQNKKASRPRKQDKNKSASIVIARRLILSHDYLPVTLINKENQTINTRFYQAKPSTKAVIMVGGIGGNFDSPARNLYPKLSQKLTSEGISSLRIEFRYPTDIEESVSDVLEGVKFLESQAVKALGFVGHSFGGAVVIQAAAKAKTAKAVVTLATQGYGSEAVADLAPGTSVFLIHGNDDPTLSPENSRLVFSLAHEPKKLEILSGNRHGLDESADKVFELVHGWLVKKL